MKKAIVLVSLLLIAGLVFAGGQQEAPAASAETAADGPWSWVIEDGDFVEVDALKVSGNVITMGSSTVFPAAEYLAAKFQDEGYNGNITIDSIGSGAGYERFAAGESDISNASSRIKQSQTDAIRAGGREPIEFLLGTDALAVVVNPGNTWVSNATKAELAQIMTAERWSDVNPSWPNQPVLKFIPGTDSGTFDYFVEAIFKKDAEPLLAASNVQLSEDDNILVRGIEGSPNAIGFFGYAYYAEEGDSLKILDIEGVTANTANVNNGTYPLARPLFMYSDANIMRTKPQVAAYLAYAINYATEAMRAVGYFAAPDEALEDARQKWLTAVGDMY